MATGARYGEAIRSELPELSPADILLEPSRRNTGAAVVVAALVLADSSDEPVAAVPADQTVADEPEFRRCLEIAARTASAVTSIVILGVPPLRPDTEYGYVEVESGSGTRRVRRFVEKPGRPVAEEYLRTGRFLWNAGIFVFRPSTLLAAAAVTAPELLEACRRYHARPSPEAFDRIPAISFDHAVMEKAESVMCVPCEAGWSDVGSYRHPGDSRRGRGGQPDRFDVGWSPRPAEHRRRRLGGRGSGASFSREDEIRALVAASDEPRR